MLLYISLSCKNLSAMLSFKLCFSTLVIACFACCKFLTLSGALTGILIGWRSGIAVSGLAWRLNGHSYRMCVLIVAISSG